MYRKMLIAGALERAVTCSVIYVAVWVPIIGNSSLTLTATFQL